MKIKIKGFSAIELLVAIGIIVMISVITIPLLVNYQKTSKLRSEARVLATNLRLAQQLAITEQNIYNVKLYPLSNSYEIINSVTSAVIKEVDLTSEVTFNSINGFTDDTVQYTPTGSAIQSGSIVLINTKGEISTLQIKPSGYVEIIE